MTRSFWKIPRAAWRNNAFNNVVVFDESATFLYVIAAERERPDLDVAGTLLGRSVREMKAGDRARFLRVVVERDDEKGNKTAVLVKAKDRKPGDVDIQVNVPSVTWMGDNLAGYLP
jgi:hypothetical protein